MVAIAVHKSSTFIGKQITAFVRMDERHVALQLADGSQLHFRVKEDGTLEVGANVEHQH